MVYKFSHVFVLATFTLLGTVVATELDAEKSTPKQLVGPPPQEQPARDPAQSIMKEPSSMAWIVLAGLIGGFVSPGLIRTKTWSQVARYIFVSSGTASMTSPAVITYYTNGQPHWCSLISFMIAFSACGAISLAELEFERLYKAGQERGIAGIKDELITLLSLGILTKNEPPKG